MLSIGETRQARARAGTIQHPARPGFLARHDTNYSSGVHEHPLYVNLLRRAYELWYELEGTVNEKLFYKTGSIDAGPEDTRVFQGSWRSCQEHDLPHQVLTGAELHRKFPGYNLPNSTMAVLQPDGGFLAPEKCIVAFVTAAQELGAEIHGHEPVLGWEPIWTDSRSLPPATNITVTS